MSCRFVASFVVVTSLIILYMGIRQAGHIHFSLVLYLAYLYCRSASFVKMAKHGDEC